MAGKRGRPVGTILSQATKDQISASKMGQTHDEKTKQKISKTLINYFENKKQQGD